MEDKETPNSHECHRRDTSRSWSDLHIDLLSLVFERLSFTNFRRAKSVCSSWYSASRQFVPTKNQIHWLILFPEENNNTNKNSCMLFNLEEKDELYKTYDLGVEFAKSVCIATYKSWLLMQDIKYNNLFITNLFTLERIDLPSVELLWKDYELRIAILNGSMYMGTRIQSPVFWIDEKTKDYLVLWGHRDWCVFYSKKGDNLWNQFRILQIVTYLVVTVTREVLKVEKWWGPTHRNRTCSFLVFKVYSSGFLKKPELIKSLDDESILLEQGITVLAKDTDGLTRNSIYYSGNYDLENTRDIFFFNLETEKTETLHTFDIISNYFSSSTWFLP